MVSSEPGHFPASRSSIPQADCKGGCGKGRVTPSTLPQEISFLALREKGVPVPGRKQDSVWDSIPGLCSHVLVPVQCVQPDPRILSSLPCQGLSWQGACPSNSVACRCGREFPESLLMAELSWTSGHGANLLWYCQIFPSFLPELSLGAT